MTNDTINNKAEAIDWLEDRPKTHRRLVRTAIADRGKDLPGKDPALQEAICMIIIDEATDFTLEDWEAMLADYDNSDKTIGDLIGDTD